MSENAESLIDRSEFTPAKGIFAGAPTVSAQGWAASILLAFLSSAGLYYVNIAPVISNALMSGAGLSAAESGDILSANFFGAALGAFGITFLIRFIPRWKPAACALLLSSIGLDLLTISLSATESLVPLRFLHGVLGGSLVGLGFAVISRSGIAGRAFGMLLAVQYLGGFIGIITLPSLVPQFGAYVPFYALITFSTCTLLMVIFLPPYPLPAGKSTRSILPKKLVLPVTPILLTLLALFCFQLANMALFAFIIDLGHAFGLTPDYVDLTVGWASFIAISGAILAAHTGDRLDLTRPLAIALVATVAGIALFLASASPLAFFAANVITGITWAFCVAYLLTMVSRFDAAGQMGAFGGFASKMGLASGPVIAGRLLSGGGDYSQLIILASLLLLVCFAALPAAVKLDRAGSKSSAEI